MRILVALLAFVSCAVGALAQSDSIPASPVKSTPVDIDDAKPRVVMHYYDKHGEPLDEPVMFLATLDTVQAPKAGPAYPVYNGVNVGIDFGDAIFLAFGQRSANFALWANCSLFNWIFPTVEVGIGYADHIKDSKQRAFTVRPSIFTKVGFNYNFLYKSSPDYQAYLGLRAGVSSFRFDVDNIRIAQEGNGQEESNEQKEMSTESLRNLRATSWYGEVVAGVQVKIVGCFSLGWSARYNYPFNKPKPEGFSPLFTPGTTPKTHFSFSMSAILTF